MQKPHKILFVFPTAQVWGGEVIWLEFLERADRNKVDPVCLVFGEGQLLEKLHQLGIKYHQFKKARIRNPIAYCYNFFNTVKLLREENFYSVSSLGVHLSTSLATYFVKVPYILHIHTIHRLPLIDRWCLRRAKHIVTASHYSEQFLQNYRIRPERIQMIYNGIDINELYSKFKHTSLRKELNLQEDVALVCYVGRIVKWKNLEFLIKAIPQIKTNYGKKVKFLFVGKMPKIVSKRHDYKNDLVKLADALKVKEEVIFTGRREDVADILNEIDIFVMPSLLEVCSMAILEAMALKKAVVAMNAGGNPELITQGSGILVEPADMQGFVNQIVKLLGDRIARQSLGEAAFKRVKQVFDIDDNIKKMQDAIECIS